MSDLFMDMHRRRWHIYQTPPTSITPSSTQHSDEHTFTHHDINISNNTNGAACSDKYNKEEEQEVDDDIAENILSLKLRKPKHWKWELSTSKSCSNIALPRILLYDHKGELLVDAQREDEHVYKQEDYEKPKRDKSKKRPHQHYQQHQRPATTNLTHSIRKALEKEFNGLQIQEATPSPEPTSLDSHAHNSQRFHRSRKAVELNTTELPDYTLSRRSSSLKGVRFNVQDDDDDDDDDYNQHIVSQIPEFLPTPPSTTTTPSSSSSGPREKRKYRRSQSSSRSSAHSESILERFSYQKGRFSSPEYAEERQLQYAPRYFLRTSKAGTLVVQEDSFSHHPLRRRRRQKNLSAESLQNAQKFAGNAFPTMPVSANNCATPNESRRKKIKPIRRHLSDGNILLNKQLSTSEEDVAVAAGGKQTVDNVNSRQIRKYSNARNQTKGKRYWESRRPKKPIEGTIKIPAVAETTTSKVEHTIRPEESATNSFTTTSTSATKVNLPLLPNIPEPVNDIDVENYDEEDQNSLKNDDEILKENKRENDEEVYVDEDETVNENENENDYENNDENINIFS